MGHGFKATQAFHIESHSLQAVVGLNPQKPWATAQALKSRSCGLLKARLSTQLLGWAGLGNHYVQRPATLAEPKETETWMSMAKRAHIRSGQTGGEVQQSPAKGDADC